MQGLTVRVVSCFCRISGQSHWSGTAQYSWFRGRWSVFAEAWSTVLLGLETGCLSQESTRVSQGRDDLTDNRSRFQYSRCCWRPKEELARRHFPADSGGVVWSDSVVIVQEGTRVLQCGNGHFRCVRVPVMPADLLGRLTAFHNSIIIIQVDMGGCQGAVEHLIVLLVFSLLTKGHVVKRLPCL